MLRRLIAIAAIVLGLAIMAAAVGSATIWRPDDQVTATLPADPEEAVVVSAPGVLNMVDDEVQVRLVGADQETPLVLAMAREPDLRAWLGTAPYLEITGLRSWEELEVSQEAAEPEEEATGEDGATEDATEDEDAAEGATEDEDAAEETEAETLPDPAGSDLWVEELTDTGELTYTWNAVPGRWMMVAATDGTEPAPQVEMTWTRQVATPLLVPGLIIGGVVFLVGVAALVLVALREREQTRARRARAEERSAAAAAAAAASERRGGRHLGAQAEAPADDLLTGAAAGATADDESLSYAQRLGWPEAGASSGAGPNAPDAPDAAALAAEGAASDTAATPTTPDGAPLTRRQIREAEAARLAEERQARKKRRWSRTTEAEQNTAEQADGEVGAATGDSSDAGTPGGDDLQTGSADGIGAAGFEAADSSAPELSQWVASGRSGKQAASIQTYSSEHPGAGLPGPGAGPPGEATSRETTSDQSPAENTTADPGSSGESNPSQRAPGSAAGDSPPSAGEHGQSAAGQDSTAPAPWWRPWQRRRTQGSGADAPEKRRSWRRKPPVEAKGREDSEQDAGPVAEAADPHASGALWRRTWGIEPPGGGGAAGPGPALSGEDGGPQDSDESPQDSTEGSSR